MKNNDIKHRISSLFLHIFFIYILSLVGLPKKFNQSEEKFEIIDTDIIGLIDQSKSKDIKVEEKILKKEVVPDVSTIEEKLKSDEQKAEETEGKKEEIKKVEEKRETLEKIKEEEPISIPDEKKELKEEKKEEVKKDEIKKGEAKKIDQILKNLEKKNEINELKKSLDKASKALNELEKKKDIINNNVQSKEMMGGGDISTAKLGSYIKSQLIACWKIPPLIGIEIEKIFVIVQIKLDKYGVVLSSKIVNKGQYGHSQFFDIISESAIQAVNLCSPIKNLPHERYDEWQEVQLVFDPSKFVS